MEFEISRGRLELWCGVTLAIGAGFYLCLARDMPPMLLYGLVALGLLGAVVLRSTPPLDLLAPLLAFLVLGAAVTDLAIRRVDTPRIEQPTARTRITGHVLRAEYRVERTPRIVLAVSSIDGRLPAETPARLQLTGRTLANVKVGEAIAFDARLRPPMQPTQIGGYHFAFNAFFDSIGGTGQVFGTPERVILPPPGFADGLSIRIDRWRMDMTARIKSHLPGPNGAIAASLITGERAGISESMLADFNASGLMHVLSISGLHMMLVAGGAYWLLRALLACFPMLALRHPIRKWAALLAIIVATYYEVLSGAAVATTRSYIMCMIAFGAILVDRPAISMRNLVLSWIGILLWSPDQLFSISAQMSFAATALIIAAYERKLFPDWEKPEQAWAARVFFKIMTVIAVSMISSIIAELAVMPFTIHHFHRMAWYGVAGNLLAHLAIEAVIMPATLAMLIALPLGLEGWVSPFLGFGVERMVDVARYVGSWPGAVTQFSGFGSLSMGLMALGVAWACLWRSWLAGLAILPYVAGFIIGISEAGPDLRVSANGMLVAVRGSDGWLGIVGERQDNFLKSRWLEADGDARSAKDPALASPARCDKTGCTMTMKGGATVALSHHPAALVEDCRRADIIVTRLTVPPDCPTPRVVLDRKALDEGQGIELWANGKEPPKIRTVRGECGTRPWCATANAQLMERPRKPFAKPQEKTGQQEKTGPIPANAALPADTVQPAVTPSPAQINTGAEAPQDGPESGPDLPE